MPLAYAADVLADACTGLANTVGVVIGARGGMLTDVSGADTMSVLEFATPSSSLEE